MISGFKKRFDRINTVYEKDGIRINALQIIRKGEECDVRYRDSWHHWAIPARRQFDYVKGGYISLDELAMK